MCGIEDCSASLGFRRRIIAPWCGAWLSRSRTISESCNREHCSTQPRGRSRASGHHGLQQQAVRLHGSFHAAALRWNILMPLYYPAHKLLFRIYTRHCHAKRCRAMQDASTTLALTEGPSRTYSCIWGPARSIIWRREHCCAYIQDVILHNFTLSTSAITSLSVNGALPRQNSALSTRGSTTCMPFAQLSCI